MRTRVSGNSSISNCNLSEYQATVLNELRVPPDYSLKSVCTTENFHLVENIPWLRGGLLPPDVVVLLCIVILYDAVLGVRLVVE